ncbi:two component transcriptional regulator, LuxR family [Citreicella sp. SE45]|uniref:response regulator transcription factor n=1 Tax=Salipiger sp. HF18 TaxID=2721557 RepID=UPI0001B8CD16|nr:response regulator transcription factor [Salipiger sp. HF18]EEX11791.1 two component transcriptional regulator, LuxR family [Citreicella sp. SE45]MAU46068.1 DNA-binding response regulator [Salipiger sp.]NIY96395.1 response regulator transcription factor [Salipiger sp. HF18]NVK62623.1 response regulator transcription factor [Paracoccaceae bacterium]
MKEYSVIIVDDHPVVREGYRRLIDLQPGLKIVGEAEDARSAYAQFRALQPDVVVMDVTLPGASGVEAVRHIRQYDDSARIVVFTMHLSAAFALKAIKAGATSYITKSSDPKTLIEAIFGALHGRTVISPDVIEAIARDRISGMGTGLSDLSPRQTEILCLLARGWPAERIAEELAISQKTVRNNHYQIKSILGMETDAQLVWFALETGLLQAV